MSDSIPFERLPESPTILSPEERRARSVLAYAAAPATRAALFRLLARVGIATVAVDFDGAGDSGQIASMMAHGCTFAIDLMDWSAVTRGMAPHDASLDGRLCPVAETIEAMAFALLNENHDGWEINDGAFGTFTFDVAARVIRLDYSERVTDLITSDHEY